MVEVVSIFADGVQAQGHDQNLIAFYRAKGMTTQEAYDQMDGLLQLRYRDWYLAQADLPQ